jgi:NTP pyrophosphatase (non-canonical NTP hydrolase)
LPGDESTTLGELKDMARRFTDERDWEQFHHPKDLAMGICLEAGELMEPFLWKNLDVDEIRADEGLMEKVREELADVLILSLCMANTLGIDVSDAVRGKMALNEKKYPVDKARGRADKYTEL